MDATDGLGQFNESLPIGSTDWPQPTTPEDNYCPLDEDALFMRHAGTFTNVRRYYLIYSPTIVVTYHAYERNNELVIREVVRYRRFPCFKNYVPMPGDTFIDYARQQQGIALGDSIGFPERSKVALESWWYDHKLLRMLLPNFIPFWQCEWHYPLPTPD
jgi:hypothetical protein